MPPEQTHRVSYPCPHCKQPVEIEFTIIYHGSGRRSLKEINCNGHCGLELDPQSAGERGQGDFYKCPFCDDLQKLVALK